MCTEASQMTLGVAVEPRLHVEVVLGGQVPQ